jgi:polo-like kinase 4
MRAAHLTKRVANEVEIHWQLRHSSILELYNYFEDSDYVYMVMELCDNGNIYQFLKNHPRGYLEEPEARGLLYQLVHGLLYLHSNGIIHRDLKLSNLLLNDKFDLVFLIFNLENCRFWLSSQIERSCWRTENLVWNSKLYIAV